MTVEPVELIGDEFDGRWLVTRQIGANPVEYLWPDGRWLPWAWDEAGECGAYYDSAETAEYVLGYWTRRQRRYCSRGAASA